MFWTLLSLTVFGRCVLPRLEEIAWFERNVARPVSATRFWPPFQRWALGRGLCVRRRR